MREAKKPLHSMLDPLDRYAMASSKKDDSEGSDTEASGGDVSHAPATESEALDLLAEWLAANPGQRHVVEATVERGGAITLVLHHEYGTARSVTQRTLASAIRTAVAIARAFGAV
jgi:hypothetical protein